MNPSRLADALAAWDRRVSNRAEDLAALGSDLAAAAREVLGAGKAAPECLCRCPETPGTHTATRCWDPPKEVPGE